jgi:hypothetical protein
VFTLSPLGRQMSYGRHTTTTQQPVAKSVEPYARRYRREISQLPIDAVYLNTYHDDILLRYSLRSLRRYVNWARHIYIITEKPITWLLPHKKIRMVSFSELYQLCHHKEIEHTIHCIPTLTDYFIYIPPKTMFGKEIALTDFITDSVYYRYTSRTQTIDSNNQMISRLYFNSSNQRAPAVMPHLWEKRVLKRLHPLLSPLSYHTHTQYENMLEYDYHRSPADKAVLERPRQVITTSIDWSNEYRVIDCGQRFRYYQTIAPAKFYMFLKRTPRLRQPILAFLRTRFPVRVEWEK